MRRRFEKQLRPLRVVDLVVKASTAAASFRRFFFPRIPTAQIRYALGPNFLILNRRAPGSWGDARSGVHHLFSQPDRWLSLDKELVEVAFGESEKILAPLRDEEFR